MLATSFQYPDTVIMLNCKIRTSFVLFLVSILWCFIGKVSTQESIDQIIASAANSTGYRRVCYHTNWSQYRPAPGKYMPESIDPFLCTHICYAFAKLNGNHLTAFEWNDESEPWSKGMFERTMALKKKNPALKILISVGGWNMGSPPFTAMVKSASSRKDFIDHGIKWMRKHGFDGLDVDWEYPANRGSPPEDKGRFSALIKETRQAFDAEAKSSGNPRLLLATAVSASQDKIDTGYDIPEISKYFDFITIMTYDLHGAWEKFTGHNSPLYVRSDEQGNQRHLNMKWAADYWVSKGAPKSILNIGMALYGRGFTLANKADYKPGAATKGPCHAGRFTREKGFLSYYEICNMIKTGGQTHWIKEQEVPYVVKGDQWVGYDNPKSLAIKTNWVKSNGYGGIAVWALPLDDFGGMCGGEKYPLMKSIVRTLGDSVVPTDGPPVTTPKPTTLSPGKKDIQCSGKPDGTYAHPESCTDYVLCQGGTAYIDHCTAGMWNDAIKDCDPTPGFECRRGNLVVTNPPVVTRKPVTRPSGRTGYRRVCYHTNWSQYRPAPGNYMPESIDPFLCTHICYAFAKLNGNHLTAFEWNDESEPWRKGMFERTMALKKKNPALKILISVGGWNMGSPPFTAMVKSASSRKDFIDHGIKWMRKHGFDGLDVDWEYPANRGSPPEDKGRFSALIKETRQAFDAEAKSSGNPRLLLATAVSASQDKIDTGYDIPEISKYFDFITIMTYDLHGAWEKFTGHNSPLYVRSDEQGNQRHLNMKWAADYWVSKGAPKSILNIGMALYGRGFTLANKADYKPGAATKGPCHAGRFTREKGFLSYYEICNMIKTGGQTHWIKEQEVPYVVKGDQWVGYDNPKSLAIKTNWVKSNGYGGIAVWALPLDDFGGMCGGEKYPLMKSIVRTLGDSVVPTDGPPVTTPKPTTLSPGKKDIQCSGKPDGTYAHPESCTDYVLCQGGTAYIDHCTAGMWNDAIKDCDPTPGFECRRGNLVVTNPPVVTRKPVTRPSGRTGYRRVCYHTNWSQYRPAPGNYMPESIDPFLCTHICYAFAKLNGNHLTAFEWNDESEPWRKGMFERTMALKKKNPALKILISVGGWNMGSPPFTAMVKSASSRKDFIDHGIKWMRKHGFDGLDVDWEYPANRGSPPEDKGRFSALIKETRQAFDAEAKSSGNPRLLLATAVSASQDKIDTGYDIPEISKYFDFITIMTYDLHGAWEKFTGHNSPLYVRSDEQGNQRHLNMKWAADYWVSKGAPKSILNIGMALYGRGFTLANKADYKPGAATKGPCHAGRFTREKGFLSYYEICNMIKTGGQTHWIKEQEVPYVVKGDQWVGYDNPKSLAIKTNWVKSNGYGGIAVWALPLDDFGGMCGGEKYPLMKSIVRTLGDSVVPTDGPPVTTPKQVTTKPVTNPPEVTTKPVSNPPEVTTKPVSNPPEVTTKPVTNPPEVTTKPVTLPSGSWNRTFCSGKADGLYPDPKDCVGFYTCAADLTYHENCGPGTGFDPKFNICNHKNAIHGCT